MKIIWLFLLSFAFSFPILAQEEEEIPIMIVTADAGSEVNLQTLRLNGILPYEHPYLSKNDKEFSLNLKLSEEDNSIKNLTMFVGGREFNFNPKNLKKVKNIDIESATIRVGHASFLGEEVNWGIFLVLEYGENSKMCLREIGIPFSPPKKERIISIILDTEEGFEWSTFEINSECLYDEVDKGG